MHKHVEILIGRLATDPGLLSRFVDDPTRALRELLEQGLELTEIEIAALAAIDPRALRALASSLDGRLRKAAPITSTHEKEMVR
jgi:hypothetical protein